MGWKQYAFALLAFNAALFVHFVRDPALAEPSSAAESRITRARLTALGYKDTAGVEHAGADTAVIFHTVCSFVTNTNLQHYSGEQHLSYFSQLGAIVWLQFVTPACGLAVMLAVIRGLRGERVLGDFYLDTMRGITLVLLPLSARAGDRAGGDRRADDACGALSRRARSSGARRRSRWARSPRKSRSSSLVPTAADFSGRTRLIRSRTRARGATCSRSISIIIIPMASIVMFGLMIKDRAHAVVIFGVMLALLLAGVAVAIHAELQPSAATAGLPVARGRQPRGQGSAAGAGSLGDLVGDHDGDVERIGEFDARQLSAAGRAWCPCRS